MNPRLAGALVALCCLSAASPARGLPPAELPRFAVVIGANRGQAGEKPLRYAAEDARRVADTLRTVGRFPPDQIAVAIEPSSEELRAILQRTNARLRAVQGDSLLVVYYSGHGDAENLHLGGTRLAIGELRTLLDGSPASSRVLVVDACRSGAITRVKGGKPVAPFVVTPDLPPPPHGMAILTSSGATEDAQESDGLQSSFFTHYFTSGLKGAADHNQDGWVTLGEAFSFASSETLVATARTAGGPQHPTYHYQLGGRQDLVLAHTRILEGGVGGLRLARPGRYLVQLQRPDGGQQTAAEMTAGARGAQLALPAGRYHVLLRSGDKAWEGQADVRAGAVTTIELQHLHRLEYPQMVHKGFRPSATGVMVGGGWRSSFLKLGQGLSLLGGVTRRLRLLSFEARLGYGRSFIEGSVTDVTTQTISLGLLVGRPIVVEPVVFVPGLEVAGLYLRQTFASNRPDFPLQPWQTPPQNAFGSTLAPVLAIELPFAGRAFFRVEAASPVYLLRSTPNNVDLQSREWRVTVHTRLLGAVGMHF